MNAEERKARRLSLKRRGFDLTISSKAGWVKPRCSQCQPLVINGTSCHETGCPNQRNNKRRR